MALQAIIEGLLRARLYRTGVRIRTRDGAIVEARVREVRYAGSHSTVLLEGLLPGAPSTDIPLGDIAEVEACTAECGGSRSSGRAR